VNLQSLVESYGYAAVFVGSLLEGETLVVMGGFAAHAGYLDLPWVVAVAFAGGFLGDQIYFHLGRWQGEKLLARFPALRTRGSRVQALLRKYDAALIVAIRFLYGLRTVGPIAIGMSGIAPLRFAAYNGAGAALWAVLIAALGFVFGHALDLLLADIERYELVILAAVAAAGLALHLVQRWRRGRDDP